MCMCANIHVPTDLPVDVAWRDAAFCERNLLFDFDVEGHVRVLRLLKQTPCNVQALCQDTQNC